MGILRTRNKITDFLMILAWASPFNYKLQPVTYFVRFLIEILKNKVVIISKRENNTHGTSSHTSVQTLGFLPRFEDNGKVPTPDIGRLPGPLSDKLWQFLKLSPLVYVGWDFPVIWN